MPRAKRQIGATLEIDGFRLIWRLHREQHWNKYGKSSGVAIHVQNEQGTHRDLFLEYPVIGAEKPGWTEADDLKVQIQAKKVAAHILLAMEAGWDPESRGKSFVFEVPEPPS